jgi:hypothetical protein
MATWKWLAGVGAAVLMIKQVRAVMGAAAAAAMVIGLGVTPVAAGGFEVAADGGNPPDSVRTVIRLNEDSARLCHAV